MTKAIIKVKNLPVPPLEATKERKEILDRDTEILLLKRAAGRKQRIMFWNQSEKSKAELKEAPNTGKEFPGNKLPATNGVSQTSINDLN